MLAASEKTLKLFDNDDKPFVIEGEFGYGMSMNHTKAIEQMYLDRGKKW